jgi:cullin 1
MKLSQHFDQYIKTKALESLESNVDLIAFITSINKIYNNFTEILVKCFDSNPLFETQLSNILNENCNKSIELLANNFDDLLKKKKKSGANGENSDELVEKALILFRFNPNKNVFKEFHLRLLSFRLIHESSECYEMKKFIVNRLNEFCGTDYTNNMQKLFQDIECSEILNKEFNETEECIQSRIGFNIKVITESVQNFVQRLHQMNYPKEIQELEEKFRKFYFGKHSGRKLKFLYELSKGEIVAKFAKDYKINASALQITVLMQFNDCNEWSVNDLVSNTNIESNVLIEVLKTLLQKRLLCDERNKRKSLPFTQNSVIRVNDKFSRKNIRFSIYEDLKNEFEGLHKRTYERIGEQNRFKMESAIVKIMKTTKQLSHKVLVQEVIKKIDIKSETLENDIKIGINHLIGRDVLKRDDNSLDIYEYMA